MNYSHFELNYSHFEMNYSHFELNNSHFELEKVWKICSDTILPIAKRWDGSLISKRN